MLWVQEEGVGLRFSNSLSSSSSVDSPPLSLRFLLDLMCSERRVLFVVVLGENEVGLF